jgi:hypothetical protein
MNRMYFDNSGSLTIEAEKAVEGEAPALPKLKIRAYNGGAMRVSGYRYPVVIDLATLKANATIPILRSHSTDRIVGHGTPTISANAIDIEAVVSSDTPDASEIVRLGKNGFPWQASVGVDVTAAPTFISEKDTVNVNGQTFAGPINVVRGGELFETSVLPLGADKTTTAAVAASSERVMTATNEQNTENQTSTVKAGVDPLEAVFAAARLKEQYRNDIALIAQRAINDGADVSTVQAASEAAIASNTPKEAFELVIVAGNSRGNRSCQARPPKRDFARRDRMRHDSQHEQSHCSSRTRIFAQVLEATDRHYRHGISLTEVLRIFARRNGWQGESNRDVPGLLKCAFAPIQAAGISTYDLSGISVKRGEQNDSRRLQRRGIGLASNNRDRERERFQNHDFVFLNWGSRIRRTW